MDTQESKPIYLIIIVFVIALGIFVYIYLGSGNKNENVPSGVLEDKYSRNIEYFDQESMPPGLPEDLPMDGSLAIKRNEIVNLTLPNGKTESQYVRSFYSEKTVAENLKTYKDYVLNKGWQFYGEVTDNKNFATFASYDSIEKKRFKFEFSYNENTEDNTVTVTLIK